MTDKTAGTASTSPAPLQAAGDDQADIVAFLADGRGLGCAIPPERIDTHAATIFLGVDRAWKLKRAVAFSYLDFSTPERRRVALEAELQLNRRTAPDLYLGLHAIRRDAKGDLHLDGAGEVVDWLLEMRRFPDDALLDQVAARGALSHALLIDLADHIQAFHAAAEAAPTTDGAAAFRRIVEGNGQSMAAHPRILDPHASERLERAALAAVDALAPLLDLRARTGRVRHAHGDLHLANIALVDGVPTMFDCLEFSKELATVDVLYDLGFLVMDLWQSDLRGAANAILNRYLDRSAVDEGGIALMPLFMSTRAAVRAHVLAAQSARAGDDPALAAAARSYLDLATDLLRPAPVRLIAIGGLSGTGKSTLARALGGAVGRAPGARIVRSDVVRKRIAGIMPEVALPPSAYTPEASERTYLALDRLTSDTLAAGASVIADAVFASDAERAAIRAAADAAGARFDALWLEAPVTVRTQRVAGRRSDASDADVRVALAQEAEPVGDLGCWHRLSVAAAPGDVADAARALLDL